jgi:hypothetical protein
MNTVQRITNSKGEIEFVPLNLQQRMEACAVWNAQGDIDTSSAGYKYVIDTLTYIVSRVTTQKFYEVTPSDFFPIEVGSGGFTDAITTNIEFSSGDDFETGVVNTGNSEARLASVEAGVAPKTMAVTMWAKKIGYNIAEIQQALMFNRWDTVEAKERSRKKNYDLGMQAISFMGSKTDPVRTPGLLTNPDVNIDTGTITKPISEMTATEFQTLVTTLLNSYFDNANATVLPTCFVLPMSDFLGLGVATSDTFPIGTKLAYLEQTFQKMCGPGFKILPLAYADAVRNAAWGINKQQYMLYRDDPETVRQDVPIAYTLNAPGTADNFTFNSVAFSRYTGVGIYRPLELLKYEFTPAS